MASISYSKSLNVKYEADVFVAGGGPAGVAAAVACARQGKSVFLAESQGCFGGMGTSGLVPAFMPFTNGVDFLSGGIGREIHDAIVGDGKIHYGCVPVYFELLKRIYDKLIQDAGVKFSFFTTVSDVICDSKGHVSHVILVAKSGTFAVKAKMFIDATGDGDICAWAGAKYEFGDENHITMPATLCSLWASIDWDKKKVHDGEMIEKAIADGVFTNEDRHLPGMFRIGRTLGGGNIGHCFKVDSTDETSLTEAMLWGRQYILEYEKYYREYLGETYKNMELCVTAASLGVRESRRIIGDYIMTGEDFNNRASFEDEIGRFSYPVDIHIMTPNKEEYEKFHKAITTQHYKDGESYGIPYRALTPVGLSNVLITGRSISADRQMQSSIRVMPGCYITGQAAGIAAAMACDKSHDIHEVNVRELQSRLLKMGAFLPNFK